MEIFCSLLVLQPNIPGKDNFYRWLCHIICHYPLETEKKMWQILYQEYE